MIYNEQENSMLIQFKKYIYKTFYHILKICLLSNDCNISLK